MELNELLKHLSEGKRKFIMNYGCDEDATYKKDIEVEVTAVQIIKDWWKPVHVKILTEGLQQTERREVKNDGFGFGNDPNDERIHMEVVKVPYKEDNVSLKYIVKAI